MKNLGFMGYDKYAVTRDGKIYSIRSGRFMTNASNKDGTGYETIGLSKDGVKERFLVHRIVAMAYIPNPENKPTVNHINGNKKDNRVENLEWNTYREQQLHAIETGLKPTQHIRTDRSADDETVHLVCQYIMQGFTRKEISEMLGVSPWLVKNIISGKQYKDIAEEYPLEDRPSRSLSISMAKARKVKELLDEGKSKNFIARNLKVDVGVVTLIKERRLFTILNNYRWK